MGPTEEITVELMQLILREAEKDSTIQVLPDLGVAELNEDLHGGSCLSRVTVKYTRQGKATQHTLSLLVKVVPKLEATKNMAQQTTFFTREIQMFNEILPRMSALLSGAMRDRHVDFSARVYYTRDAPSYLIAIEDLAPKGFKAPKRALGLDLEHSLLALRTLARFHAASVMIHRDDGSLFAVFDKYCFQEKGLNDILKKMSEGLTTLVLKKVESWPDFGPGWADRLRRRYLTMFDDLQPLWRRDEAGFNVLNHGDFGLHNVMYRHCESGGEADAIMLVDFQCCSYNSPVLDLLQFVFGSVSDDVRTDHVGTLLRGYHSELTAALRSLGAPREQHISFAGLLEEFDSKMLYGLFYSTLILPFLGFDLSSQSDVTMENITGEFKNLPLMLTDSFYSHFRKLLPLFSQKKLL
ncbi:uncharacterized protein LOC134537811 [Bacillus rossius redtenbacheri]|uniref:uncharacterized protein LOC134537811 n=1 Tax=Bacillus rossius redtenbacheri TaxID=93214 RepID=UPI002FDD98F5